MIHLLPIKDSRIEKHQLHVDINPVDHHQEKMMERKLIDRSFETRDCRVPWNFIFEESSKYIKFDERHDKLSRDRIEKLAQTKKKKKKECDHLNSNMNC